MKFDDLDARMRVFETARDQSAPPDVFLVARIDGRSFTRLTKETMNYARPFDESFRDAMIATVEHLMSCGFQSLFGYTQSDEISLLFARDENSFGRSFRKWLSILAGEASGAFSAKIGRPAAFDCRVIELPTDQLVIDYFRWRSEDARRNALNAWCYWTLRGEGQSAPAATRHMEGMPVAEKIALLAARSIVFEELPSWQRRGMGVVWEEYDKAALNPKTGQLVTARRSRLKPLLDLPEGEAYSEFIARLLVP